MDAWETRYADQRQAAIYRLEQLCIEKHHLKLPNNASNPNSKAKKKNVDVSQLKGPAIDDANKKVPTTSQKAIETDSKEASEEKSGNVRTTSQDISERTPIKASKLAVTAKPHGVRTTFAPVGNGRMVSSRKSQDSPEPMSTDMSEAERSSRSPSPIKDDEDMFPNIMESSSSTKTVDNANLITTSFAQNSDRSTTTNAATNNTTSTGHNINDLNENQKNDNDVPNQAT